MDDSFDVVIVGGGHGGAQAAIQLRQAGYDGSVAIVTEEPDPPYERPPLSKTYLAGAKEWKQMLIRPEAFWGERTVEMRLGERVTSVDPDARRIATTKGEVGYRHLIWATGGRARRLRCPGGDLPGVHVVRTRADSDAIRVELADAKRAVVVGGGYIGLETAAVLTKQGVAVTLLENAPRVLGRVAGEVLSRFYEAEHRAHGVDLRLDTALEAIEGTERVTGVRLADGTVLPCDLVVVGIGIEPATSPLTEAGAEGGNGVLVDEACRTSLPDIYAVGDCALHRNRYADGEAVRIESVQNANDQANTAVRAIMGEPAAYDAAPWFWSNQYDLKLQTIGLSTGHDMAVLRGSTDARSFSVVYLRGGRVIALDCVNAVKDYVAGRRLVTEGVRATSERLADASAPLKEIA